MSDKNLIIINNEKIFKESDSFYCDNLDLKVLPEGLNEYYKVHYIVRKSNKKGDQKINLKNIKVASNIIIERFLNIFIKFFYARKCSKVNYQVKIFAYKKIFYFFFFC